MNSITIYSTLLLICSLALLITNTSAIEDVKDYSKILVAKESLSLTSYDQTYLFLSKGKYTQLMCDASIRMCLEPGDVPYSSPAMHGMKHDDPLVKISDEFMNNLGIYNQRYIFLHPKTKTYTEVVCDDILHMCVLPRFVPSS